jgi:hypothetical protein
MVVFGDKPVEDAPAHCPQCEMMCGSGCSDLVLSVTVSAASWAAVFFGIGE